MKHLFIVFIFALSFYSSIATSDEYNDNVSATDKQKENSSQHFIVVLDDQPLVTQVDSKHTITASKSNKTVNRLAAIRNAQATKRSSFKHQIARLNRQTKFINEYKELFNGLAVTTELPKNELLKQEHVKAVYPVNIYRKKLDAALSIIDVPEAWEVVGGQLEAGRNTRIAIIDSGIIPEHPMFDDSGMSEPSSRPTDDYCSTQQSSFCNNKLIVARHYPRSDYNFEANDEVNSPRASRSHGVHVAAIATGREVVTDNNTTISGVAPGAYLMVYKALWGSNGEATDVELLDALEDAYTDGANVINNSWGGEIGQNPINTLYNDILRQLEERGVVVVSAAGNEGDLGESTINCPACVEHGIAVAATTTTKTSGNVLSFGAQEVISSPGSNYTLGDSFDAPVVLAPNSNRLGCSAYSTGSLTGQVVVVDRGDCFFTDKAVNAQNAGAEALIVVNNVPGRNITMVVDNSSIITTFISQTDGDLIKSYIASTANPNVSMSAITTSTNSESASNQLTDFSSRGPNGDETFLKPDLAAPGESILAAINPSEAEGNNYGILSGTSMATPMVSGAASVLKAEKPELSAVAIKNILINSTDGGIASFYNRGLANGFETGSGRLNLNSSLNLEAYANKANLVLDKCGARCQVTSELVSISENSNTWQGTVSFQNSQVSATLSPILLTTSGMNSNRTFTMEVTLPADGEQDWYHGELVWSNGSGQTIRQAIAVENDNTNNQLLTANVTDNNSVKTISVESSNITSNDDVQIQLTIEGNAIFDESSYTSTSSTQATSVQTSSNQLTVNATLNHSDVTIVESSAPVNIDLSSQSGVTRVNCTGTCDDYTATLGFSFSYLGESYNRLTVNDNGFLMAGIVNVAIPTILSANRQLPDNSAPNNIIAPMWMDFNHLNPSNALDTGGGEILVKEHISGGVTYLIVQWDKSKVYFNPNDGRDLDYWGLSSADIEFTFQVIIQQNTDNIWFNYLSIPEQPNLSSIGVENDDGTFGYDYWFNRQGINQINSGDVLKVNYQSPETISFDVTVRKSASGTAAVDDSAATFANTPVELNLTNNDNNRIGAELVATIGSKSLSKVLYNDESIDTSSISIISQPSNGRVTIQQNGNVEYVPNTDFTGTDSFDYRVTTSLNNTLEATATITVTEVSSNEEPEQTPPAPSSSSGGGGAIWLNLPLLCILLMSRQLMFRRTYN